MNDRKKTDFCTILKTDKSKTEGEKDMGLHC